MALRSTLTSACLILSLSSDRGDVRRRSRSRSGHARSVGRGAALLDALASARRESACS